MLRGPLKDRLAQGRFFLDGGMGSQLIARQVTVTTCNDSLNLNSPEVIEAIHMDYLNAGSSAVLTNTFGANAISLARHGMAEQSVAICRAGAEIARRAAGPKHYVIGDIGPCGEFLAPLGTRTADELCQVFREQAEALVAGGVDGILVETMTALEEIVVAIEAARVACPDGPVLGSLAFDTAGESFRTMMGVDVATAVKRLVEVGIDGIGFNCGSLTLAQYEALGSEFVQAVAATGAEVFLFAEPNAGKPEVVDGDAVYTVTPAQFADTAEHLFCQGIRILGGCCGTGPEHIGAAVQRLASP